MDYERLKGEIEAIVEIASSIPEQFQQKCFEILLSATLTELATPLAEEAQRFVAGHAPQFAAADEGIPMTTSLRVFMQRREVATEDLQRVLMYADGEVHFLSEPSNMAVAHGQMAWALLLALKNAILIDKMETDPEDVRSVCKAKGFYDVANFAATFKREPYAEYFKKPLEPQGEPQLVSQDGETELAELIKKLAKEK